MLLDQTRKRFVDAGLPISPRDDVSITAAAWFLGKQPKTLDNWRALKRGPAYVNLGRCIRYPLTALVEYLERRVELA